MATDKQKGVSLIITFFIMIIILAVVLSVSVLLYSEVKVMRNIGNSTASLYAADSGIEKVLYYDRKVLATNVGVASRGLCSMYDTLINNNACPDSTQVSGLADSSLYCNNSALPYVYKDPSNNPNGCDPVTCNDCLISFNTTLDTGATYYVSGKVYPDGESSDFEVESRGAFNGAQRQIEVLIPAPQAEEALRIQNACATPISTQQGYKVYICANVDATIPGDTIGYGSVVATIRDSATHTAPGGDNLLLTLNLSTNDPNYPCTPDEWGYIWDSGTNLAQAYYVDLEVHDTLNPPTDKKITSLKPYPMCLGFAP